mmetsp:Transcript_23729/g.34594  ORF Transcript_23729/g.34594 Transcript_23729/m.34594 type:complete len:369 (-) Transcript_23729:157-1263(-)
MLEACPQAASVQNQDGETPLHLASEGASEEVQMMLIDARKEAASMVDKYGDSPLHLACASGSGMKLLRKLVEADPSMILRPNRRGISPFFSLSKSYENAQCMEDLEEGGAFAEDWAKVMLLLRAVCRIPKGGTFLVLHAATEVECPRAVVRAAARFFPSQASLRDENGRSPLAIAALTPIFEEPEMSDEEEFGDENYNLSVETVGNDRGSKDKSDVENKKKSVIATVLEACPRSATMPDADGRYPLALALENGKGFDQGLREIIAAAPRLLDTRDTKTHMYPFMMAAVGTHGPSFNTVYELLRSFPELVQIGVSRRNVNETDSGHLSNEDASCDLNNESSCRSSSCSVLDEAHFMRGPIQKRQRLELK